MKEGRVRVASRIEAPAPVVWERVTSAAGINDEMRPLMRMTVPRGARGLDIATARDGERLGRSWLLLGGLVPFDYDDITLERIEPGRAFRERSTMLSQRRWEHDRRVEPGGEGWCTVSDELRFEPRVPALLGLVRALVARFFEHRHRRLRRRFGGGPLS